MSKQDRLLAALQNGSSITVPQAVSRFGFTASGVRTAVQNLRSAGYAIYENNGSYRIGKPSRKIVAAGYNALGGDALR